MRSWRTTLRSLLVRTGTSQQAYLSRPLWRTRAEVEPRQSKPERCPLAIRRGSHIAEEFHELLVHIREPYRTMVLIAGCLGLRAGEIVGFQWGDFDFEKSTLLVQRSVVHGHVDDVKTEYSRDSVPLAPELAAEILKYREQSNPTEEGWLFANPRTGDPTIKRKSKSSTSILRQRRQRSKRHSDGRRFATATALGLTRRTHPLEFSGS
jgi:integrase